MSRIQEIEAELAALEERHTAARSAQFERDLEQLLELKKVHGFDKVFRIDLNVFVEELPTMVIGRMPKRVEQKRYEQTATGKNADPLRAAHELADVVLVYPDRETYEKVLEASPGIHSDVALRAIKLSQGKADEEGKG